MQASLQLGEKKKAAAMGLNMKSPIPPCIRVMEECQGTVFHILLIRKDIEQPYAVQMLESISNMALVQSPLTISNPEFVYILPIPSKAAP
jgi:hypothetical protein